MSKYTVGQKVLINKVFTISENMQGFMKTLEEPLEAIILEVSATASFGPCYRIKWSDSSILKSKIRYWEDDILGPVTTH